MKRTLALLAVAAVLAAVLVSGCTQQPGPPAGGGSGPTADKSAEDKAASALESELDQAVANISSSDLENALLNP